MRLTDLSIKGLKPPERGQATYTDDTLPGFGVRVSQGGTKTFVLVYGKRRSRRTIGRYPILSLSDARTKARNILAERTLTGDYDPMSFEEAYDLFLMVHCKQRNKSSTAAETERLLKRHFLPDFKAKMMHSIGTRDATAILDRLLDTPSECNHAFTALRTFFRFTVRRKIIRSSPLDGQNLPAKVKSRDRVLTATELPLVFKTSHSKGRYGGIVRFLILTGQRLGQIANLDAAFIDRQKKTITWPGELMKGGEPHTIPYGPKLLAMLEELPDKGLLFPSDRGLTFTKWSDAKHDFDKSCPLPHWTLHDLRRTFSTNMAELKVPPHIVEKILAHRTGVISGVAAIYNRYAYEAEMREAMELYEKHITRLMLRKAA